MVVTEILVRRTRLMTVLVAVSIALCAACGNANAAIVVVPNAAAIVEGNSNGGYPLHTGAFSVRYQEVFGASEFSSLPGPEWITTIAFRPDGTHGSAFSSTLSDIQINLSTTSASVDGLSASFANNIGGDDTVVLNRGALSLSSSDTGAGPRDFDVIVTLDTPFLYDPSAGNLLLDVRNFAGGATTEYDTVQTLGDAVSRLYSHDVNSLTGLRDTNGLVVQFNTTAVVPEPSSVVSWITLSLCGLAFTWRRRRQAA